MLVCASLIVGSAHAETSIKIGVLTDLSGPYADLSGNGSIIGTQLAVEEFTAQHKDVTVQVISADHQNKPDIATAIARKWFDQEGVDAVVDIANSGVALAVSQVSGRRTRSFWQRPRLIRFDWKGLLSERHALGLRHVRAQSRYRGRASEGRWR